MLIQAHDEWAIPPTSPRARWPTAHHLALAGRSEPLCSDDATALLHQTSRGVPRLVNNVATQALVAAFADRKAIVDESSARAAVTEVAAE